MESYKRGLITELIGRIRIEKKGYHVDAFIASERCRNETMLSGTQQKKSVRIIAEILA